MPRYAANSGRFSANPAEDALIEELMGTYGGRPPRCLSMEREWDENDEQIAARPYSRVRSVEVYDGKAWADAGMPSDYSSFKFGTRMERW